MRINKWGNSLAVRLPNTLVEALQLQEGDDIILVPGESNNVFRVAKNPEQEAALTSLRKFRGRLPKDFHFDREEANAR